jgi:hypothetical protein
VNHHPLQYCIQSQEEEFQPEDVDMVNLRKDGPNPKIIVVLTIRRMSNVGIVESQDTTKISVGSQERTKMLKTKQMLLQPQKEVIV